jgi:outer membrane protein assembly factor BamB
VEYLAKLEGAVLSFGVIEQHVDCICGKKLLKIEKESGKVIYEKKVFEKEGLARILISDNNQIFISDFCTLYVLNHDKYELLGKWQIGVDLSSDICGMAVDENTIYCSIRNGKLVTVDRSSFERKEYFISNSSMWSLKLYEKNLLCGTVDGQLLLVNRETMTIERNLNLGKQNIRSLYVDGKILYAASQDKKLYKINLLDYEIVDVIRNVHNKMFDCAGVYDDIVVTVSYPCSKVALWNKDTLKKIGEIQIPLKLSGCTCIDGKILYISSRNISGIGLICLNNMSNLIDNI